MTLREENDRRDRRDLDRKFEKLDMDIKNVAAIHAQEMSDMEGRMSEVATWQGTHDAKDEERWKNNGEKWAANDKRHEGMDLKLNAIIGTSILTLLSALGFFVTLWIDRQEGKSAAAKEPPRIAQQWENQ